MAGRFEIKYQVDDGYVGKGRPQSCYVSSDDLPDDPTDQEIEDFMYQVAHDDMQQKVQAAVSTEPAEFLQWARVMIKAR